MIRKATLKHNWKRYRLWKSIDKIGPIYSGLLLEVTYSPYWNGIADAIIYLNS